MNNPNNPNQKPGQQQQEQQRLREQQQQLQAGKADLGQIKEHMEIVGSDGAHVGTVDKVEGNRIKMTKRDGASHGDHHHYIPADSIAAVEGNRVRLSTAGNAATQEKGGGPVSDKRS